MGMTIDEAIEHGKEQLDVFGGEHAEFIKLAIKALEQEDILDKIRAEIEQLPSQLTVDGRRMVRSRNVFRIIDKYRAESEEE